MKAKYYQGTGEVADNFIILHVLKENKDSTLDLGNAAGDVLVEKCPPADEGMPVKPGHAVLIKEAKEEKEAKPPKK